MAKRKKKVRRGDTTKSKNLSMRNKASKGKSSSKATVKSGSKKKSSSTAPESKKTRSEQYAEIPIEEIVKMTTSPEDIKELIKMVNTMRSGARVRIQSIERAGMYSYAADKFAPSEKTVREMLKGKTPTEQRNILVHEFARYQAFFESKSSSKTGIRDIEREQDIRIFGADENGNPRATLSRDDRMRFWALYAEYANSHAVEVTRYGSDRIQQMIAEFAIQKPEHEGDFPFQKMLDFLEEHMKEA